MQDVGLFEVLAWSAHTGGEAENHPNKGEGGVKCPPLHSVVGFGSR